MATIVIKPKNRNTRFVALDAMDKRHILVEGIKAASVSRRAQATGHPFTMLYIPRNNEMHSLRRAMR